MPLDNPAAQLEAFRNEVPTRMYFALEAIRDAARICVPMGSRALLVTGRQTMQRLGVVQQLCADLEAVGITWVRFADLHAGPTTDDIDRGAAVCRKFKAELIIALGGGNVIDGAKAIAAVSVSTSCAADFLYGREVPGGDTLPLVAIPTTAGTGSELNRSAIITDPQLAYRDGIRSNRLFPRVAIVDPTLTCSLDRIQTTITGFDCLSHAIESYVSPKARRDTDQLARQAMQLVHRYLPAALADPNDREARTGLAVASTTMGVNLSCVGTCYPHRVDKALCGLYPNIPHGQSVAIFYPHWIARSWPGNAEKFADVAEILAPETAALSSHHRAEKLSTVMLAFLKRLDLNRSLCDFGVARDQIPELAKRVLGDLSVNPVPVNRNALPDLLLQVLEPREVLP